MSVLVKFMAFGVAIIKTTHVASEAKLPFSQALGELDEANEPYQKDRSDLLAGLAAFASKVDVKPPASTKPQHASRKAFDPLAERIRGLIKQVDLVAKVSDRVQGQIIALISSVSPEAKEELDYDRRGVGRLLKQLDDDRHAAAEQLRQALTSTAKPRGYLTAFRMGNWSMCRDWSSSSTAPTSPPPTGV